MLYRFAGVTLLIALLSSCSESGFTAFENPTTATTSTTSGSGGSGGDGGSGAGTGTGTGTGTTTNYNNLTLKSHIPAEIPLTSGLGTQTFSVGLKLYMGSSDTQLAFTGRGAIDTPTKLYRVDASGQTELDNNGGIVRIANDNTTLVHAVSSTDISIIDIATAVQQQIASSHVLFLEDITITDDGSLVAFINPTDLTGGNPGNFYQIFTLSTDGNDTITQVTNFSENHFFATTAQLAISGDGTRIFFHSKDDIMADGSNADGSDEVFTINTDGSGLAQLTSIDESGRIVEMKTDSTGSIVVFSSFLPSNRIYAVDTATSTATLLTTLGSSLENNSGITNSEDQFDLSADGSTVFYMDSNGNTENQLRSIAPDGTNDRLLFSMTFGVNFGSMKSPQAAADASYVTFIADGDFGKTVAGENQVQIYTLTGI